jgi:hydrogenase maturation factor
VSALAPPTPAPKPDLADDLAAVALALARAIARGATLWCVAPSAPAHAAHVAVEFLHPVIMGKRAVPAVAVEGDRTRAVLGAGVRLGDVLVLIGPVGTPDLLALARRGAPWGATTLWLATDARRAPVDADLVVHVDATTGPGGDPTVALVLAYHLLWELTHVVFEHPGLLDEATPDVRSTHCIACADEGRLAEVVSVDHDDATVRIDGGVASAAIALVDELAPGDLVLVHAGVAIARIDEDDR